MRESCEDVWGAAAAEAAGGAAEEGGGDQEDLGEPGRGGPQGLATWHPGAAGWMVTARWN